MNRKQHIKITESIMGEGFEEVQIWIDETFKPHLGYAHWINRHNLKALEEKYGKFTKEYWAGVIHILFDWHGRFGIVELPDDPEHCERLLKEYELI